MTLNNLRNQITQRAASRPGPTNPGSAGRTAKILNHRTGQFEAGRIGEMDGGFKYGIREKTPIQNRLDSLDRLAAIIGELPPEK